MLGCRDLSLPRTPWRHKHVRGLGGAQSREHLDRQERVPTGPVEQVPYLLVNRCPKCVAGQLADRRAGQRPQV